MTRERNSVSSMESFIPISPGEQLKITVEAESRNQVISTQQIQCTHGKDQLEYNFGGSILKLDYNEEVCREMCFLKSLYKSCNCTLLIGWNYTQSECLEKFEYRKCIQKTIEDDDEYMENIVKGCKKSCYPLCQNSYYRLNTDRTLKFPTVHYLLQELYAMANQTMQDPLVRKLLKMAEDEVALFSLCFFGVVKIVRKRSKVSAKSSFYQNFHKNLLGNFRNWN